MAQENKELLLKDLCAREPYHPMIRVFNDGYEGFQDGEFDTNLWFCHIDAFRFDRIEILPYLRPMSSMTEEEITELNNLALNAIQKGLKVKKVGYTSRTANYETVCIDYYNSHHLDYRGLIEKGLALKAPEDMYKID